MKKGFFNIKKEMKMKQTILAAMLLAGTAAYAEAPVAVGAPSSQSFATTTSTTNADLAAQAATTNKVYIDQNGASPNVNIVQDGNSNKFGGSGVGSELNPVYLRGGSQTVISNQKGSLNQVSLAVVNAALPGAGEGAKVQIQQIGNSNKIDAASGYGTASNGTTSIANGTTGFKNVDLNWKFTGDNNVLQFRGGGDDIKSAIAVTGNTNKFYIDAVGNKHSQTISFTGDTNTFNLSQTGTSTNGSSIQISGTTTGGVFNIAQSGSQDNVVSITSVSTSGTFNIVQK